MLNTLDLMGKSIFIEGPDFSGKSTLMKELIEFFNSKINVMAHRQPGATPVGEKVRDVLFNNGFDYSNSLWAERMLFSADHADFVSRVLIPNKENKTGLVLCDRYNPMSNFVYGCCGRGLDGYKMAKVNEIICQGYHPDLIIILDITEETMMERFKKRQEEKGEINYFDLEGIDFKRRLMDGYKIIDITFPQTNIVHIDGNGGPKEVLAKALNVITKTFEEA